MTQPTDSPATDDPYSLSRFVQAQEKDYARALAEIKNGQKRTHWMWYIFPQVDGLGQSTTARFYSIKSIDEARAYLQHPILGSRLIECAQAVIGVHGLSAAQIFGTPDDMKLLSSATLFACISPPGSVFESLIEKYYASRRDESTLRLLGIK
jgi:uncharacterized protein (DUF1810 family)